MLTSPSFSPVFPINVKTTPSLTSFGPKSIYSYLTNFLRKFSLGRAYPTKDCTFVFEQAAQRDWIQTGGMSVADITALCTLIAASCVRTARPRCLPSLILASMCTAPQIPLPLIQLP